MNQAQTALYIDPPSHHFLGDRLFDGEQAKYAGDQLLAPYVHLRAALARQGIPVHTADLMPGTPGGPAKVYVSMGRLGSYRRLAQRADVTLSAFFAMECPIVDPAMYRAMGRAQPYFKRLYSWSDGASLERFTGRRLALRPFCWPQSFDCVHEQLWRRENRSFLVMINSNKLPQLYWQELYTERLRAVAHFSRTDEIDLYGREWEQPAHRLGRTWIPYTLRKWERQLRGHWQRFRPDPLLEAARSVYRGRAESKSETLSRYTFALCFENMVLKGWITEKLFDCFFAGTVPIYWGAPDIEKHVPRDSFIDMRHFATYADLSSFLRSLTVREIKRYRDSARAFVESPRFYPFSKDAFVDIFRQIVCEDTQCAGR